MITHRCEQDSEEWLQLRLGVVTASCFAEIITPAKLELSKSSVRYLHKLLAEWMYGAPLEAFFGGWMDRGKELEPEAVRYYEMDRDVETQAVGFVTTDEGTIGASPDRLVGEVGLLELKCPALETHVGYMLDPQSLLMEYRMQQQGQLWVCRDREYCEMMSYSPGFPAVIVRSYRDDRVQRALDVHLPAFVETMLAARVALTERYGELRRERLRPDPVEASRAAFDEFMGSQLGGVV
jgi:hypothetical protein